MIWKYKSYGSLSIDELYQILRVRQEVFVIEQDCNYLDADNLDKYSVHLLCYKKNILIAYMRIYFNADNVNEISFGRCNEITDSEGFTIADIVEVLPHSN